MTKQTETPSRNHRIIVSLLGGRFAACHVADYADMNWHIDCVQTGIGRYATREEAEQEARDWSEADGIPFVK